MSAVPSTFSHEGVLHTTAHTNSLMAGDTTRKRETGIDLFPGNVYRPMTRILLVGVNARKEASTDF